MKYCEVTWQTKDGPGDWKDYFVPRCPHPGEFVAVSIGDQSRHVFVVCAHHKSIAETMPLNWAVAPLPEEAALGVKK